MRELLETACDLERVAFIFNPVSGTEDLKTRRTRLESLAREAGLSCPLVETDAEAGAAPLAREAMDQGMERLIVCGGDGSVVEAAEAVTGTDTSLAVIPGGTGNLLAVNLGLPTDPVEAMRLAVSGTPRAIDVGRANGRVFLIMAGMGVDARVIQDADRELKRRFGFLAYFAAAWRNRSQPRVTYRVTLDGRPLRRRAQTVLIANLGRVTGGVELVPGAGPRNGILEVGILRARTPLDLLLIGLEALLGLPRDDRRLEIHPARHVVVETAYPQPVQLDGNEAGSTRRLEVHVEPAALRLVLPEGPIQPITPQELAGAAVGRAWVPVAVAAGTFAAVAYGTYRQSRKRQPQPSAGPFLAAVLAGAAAAWVIGRTPLGRPYSRTQSGPSDPRSESSSHPPSQSV